MQNLHKSAATIHFHKEVVAWKGLGSGGQKLENVLDNLAASVCAGGYVAASEVTRNSS